MPSLTIQRTEEASLDIRLQSDWYDVHAGADISERYLMSLVETLNDLAVQPDLGRVRKFRNRRLAGLRSFQIQGSFHKHLIFYRIEDDTLVLFRVLQGMRDLPRRLLEPPGSE